MYKKIKIYKKNRIRRSIDNSYYLSFDFYLVLIPKMFLNFYVYMFYKSIKCI